MKLYKAVITGESSGTPGKHVEVKAENLEKAKAQLEAEYGSGRLLSLYNEDDAGRAR